MSYAIAALRPIHVSVANPHRLILGVLFAWAAWLTVGSLAMFTREFPVRDFVSFYQGVTDFWHTGFLYAPRPFINLNAPHVSVLLFSPLLVLNLHGAAIVWFLFSALLLGISVAVIRAELQLSTDRVWWVVAVLLASSALQHNWRQGQLGLVLMFLCTMAWRAARNGKSTSGWIAVATTFKPWMVIWIFTQDRRAALRTVLIGAAGVLLGLIVFGVPNWLGWKAAIDNHGVWPYPSNIGLFGMVVRASGQMSVTSAPMWPFMHLWIGACVLLVAATWPARHGSVDRSWLLWGITGMLLSPITWSYYLLVLTGPLLAWGETRGWPRSVLIALGIFLVPSDVVNWLWSYSVWAGSLYTFGALVLWAAVASNCDQLCDLTTSKLEFPGFSGDAVGAACEPLRIAQRSGPVDSCGAAFDCRRYRCSPPRQLSPGLGSYRSVS